MDIVVKRPIITEKSLRLAGEGVYTFEVDPRADKPKISRAVEKLFTVKVLAVSTTIRKGGTKRAGRYRKLVKESEKKIALVKLAKDQKIELFDVSG